MTCLIDAYLTSLRDLPALVARAPLALADEPADMLKPVSGLLSTRVVMVLHNHIQPFGRKG